MGAEEGETRGPATVDLASASDSGAAPTMNVQFGSNLAARSATASVLGGFVVGGILYLPYAVMAGFFLLATAAAAFEWARLIGVAGGAQRSTYALLVPALAIAIDRLGFVYAPALYGVLLTACAWWLLVALWVVQFARRGRPRMERVSALAVCGTLVLVPAGLALLSLLRTAPLNLLILFALVWSADVFAYAGGKRWGRRRMCARVSPGKTWEGLGVGVCVTLILALVLNHAFAWQTTEAAAPLIMLTIAAAVTGDLFESLIKRLRQVKDSGSWLPGHGGVLDRVDSVVAAAPVFTVAFDWLGRP